MKGLETQKICFFEVSTVRGNFIDRSFRGFYNSPVWGNRLKFPSSVSLGKNVWMVLIKFREYAFYIRIRRQPLGGHSGDSQASHGKIERISKDHVFDILPFFSDLPILPFLLIMVCHLS